MSEKGEHDDHKLDDEDVAEADVDQEVRGLPAAQAVACAFWVVERDHGALEQATATLNHERLAQSQH